MIVCEASKGDAAHGQGRVRSLEPRGAQGASRAGRAHHNGAGALARRQQSATRFAVAGVRRSSRAARRNHAVDAKLVWNQSARVRSEEHTSELQSLMRISYAVCCLKKKRT